jgi:hypothetical protein
LRALEFLTAPFKRWVGLHHVVVLRKTGR